jgi:hypothetical protein
MRQHDTAKVIGAMRAALARTPAATAALARTPRPVMVGAVVATVWLVLIAALPGSPGERLGNAVGGQLATKSGRFAQDRTAVFRVYLDPQGSDGNDGTAPERAVRSLPAAQRVISAARPGSDVEVRIKQGIYVAPPTEWTTYVPGHTITFLPLDFEFGEERDGISGRPIFRGDGSKGFWFRAGQPSAGRHGDTRLGFYFLQVENYSAGGIAFDGGTALAGRPVSAPAGAGPDGNTVYGMVFRGLGSRHVRSGVGFGAIDLINSDHNIIQNNTFWYLENIGNSREATLIHGVYLSHHSSDNLITGNSFHRISGDPIRTRDNSNRNRIFNNTFKRTGANAYFSDWFDTDEGAARVECASRGNEFYSNQLISGYHGSIEEWWTNPLGAGYAARGCGNDGTGRVHARDNRRD